MWIKCGQLTENGYISATFRHITVIFPVHRAPKAPSRRGARAQRSQGAPKRGRSRAKPPPPPTAQMGARAPGGRPQGSAPEAARKRQCRRRQRARPQGGGGAPQRKKEMRSAPHTEGARPRRRKEARKSERHGGAFDKGSNCASEGRRRLPEPAQWGEGGGPAARPGIGAAASEPEPRRADEGGAQNPEGKPRIQGGHWTNQTGRA